MGRLIGKAAMTDAERQRRHREKAKTDPALATSQRWLDQAEQVTDALRGMAWVARTRGVDDAPLWELADSFDNLEAELYDQMWPERSVT
jgi:hypothetical protein